MVVINSQLNRPPEFNRPYRDWLQVAENKKTDERFGYSSLALPSPSLHRMPSQVLAGIAEELKALLDDSRFNPRREEAKASLRAREATARNEAILQAKIRRAARESIQGRGGRGNIPRTEDVDVCSQFFSDCASLLKTSYGLELLVEREGPDGNALINIMVKHSKSRLDGKEMRKAFANVADADVVAHAMIALDEFELHNSRPPPGARGKEHDEFIRKYLQ